MFAGTIGTFLIILKYVMYSFILMLQVLSQRPFPKRILPKGLVSQEETSQMCNFPSLSQTQRLTPQPVLAAALGPFAHPSRNIRPNCSLRRLKMPNLPLGSCRLGNFHLESRPWENAFGKVPLVQLKTDQFKLCLLYNKPLDLHCKNNPVFRKIVPQIKV